ncbi:hypothetical protein AVEN_264040-1 [Araneus ventricosus]|uniref:Uncharacterized protein n=1 Tax=Araneus ventricosus TaxID=182803 RepID=A0A4Y2HK37_ARAVE|nr:hypothetical protein AVEN_264040-1 [Araneus ventricosus]
MSKFMIFKTLNQNIQDVHSAMRENHGITILELSKKCSISYGSVQIIRTEDLGTTRVFAKSAPNLLLADQKEESKAVLVNNLEKFSILMNRLAFKITLHASRYEVNDILQLK